MTDYEWDTEGLISKLDKSIIDKLNYNVEKSLQDFFKFYLGLDTNRFKRVCNNVKNIRFKAFHSYCHSNPNERKYYYKSLLILEVNYSDNTFDDPWREVYEDNQLSNCVKEFEGKWPEGVSEVRYDSIREVFDENGDDYFTIRKQDFEYQAKGMGYKTSIPDITIMDLL